MRKNTEEIVGIYGQQISDLSKTVVALKSKVKYLEDELAERERVPVPRSVVLQMMKYEQQKRNMIAEFKKREQKLLDDIEYYKRYVQESVIINKENKEKPVRDSGVSKLSGGTERVKKPDPVPERKSSGIPKGEAKAEVTSNKVNFGTVAVKKVEEPTERGGGIPKGSTGARFIAEPEPPVEEITTTTKKRRRRRSKKSGSTNS
jgi:hypothetical protein